ncbi:hypothetical protein M6D81_30935 [Paenibacillus sp. J5C_2022]|uniref:hypothetical protein n=1 Tax=Paenibacillus sp. J5C2022 TaxID=2977129 RepID=UPI0021D006C4|nr:hypothetical protein [Paenibacillus sp. J5C2022]MCU6713124.1 hypothetical protein [Paenibacillus sp. J5C2022]
MKSKRKLSVMLSLVLMGTLISACGSASDNGQNGGSKPAATAATQSEETNAGNDSGKASGNNDKTLDISMAYFNIGKAFPNRENDEFLKKLEKDFNMKVVDKVISYSDYQEKLQLWSVSGELPDVFSHDFINKETYYTWIEQGIIRPLPDDLSKYPNVEKVLSLPDTQNLKVDGKFYMIPRLTYRDNDSWALDKALVVRKDWMDKLGLQEPVTYKDYSAMLTAFAKNDPDGNGKDDTIGLTFRSSSMLTSIAMGTLPNIANGSWVKEDGQYIPYYASEKMTDVAVQMRNLFANGAIDPDFAIMKTNDGIDKFGQGKVGALAGQATPNALKQYKTAWEKYNPDVKFEDAVAVIPVSWANEEGKRYRFTNVAFWSESYFSSAVDDEKMDRILQLYDYLLSDEFLTVKAYGFEGVDYKKEGDKFVITRDKNEDGTYVGFSEQYPSLHYLFGPLAAWNQQMEYEDSEINTINYGEDIIALSHAAFKHHLDSFEPIPTNYAIQFMYTPAKAKLGAINPSEDITKLMLGKGDPAAEWEKIAAGYDDKGLQEAIAEVNEKAKAEGIQ